MSFFDKSSTVLGIRVCIQVLNNSHSVIQQILIRNALCAGQSAVGFTKMSKIFYLGGRLQIFYRWRQDLFTNNSNTNLKSYKALWKCIGRGKKPFPIKLKGRWRIWQEKVCKQAGEESRVSERGEMCGHSGWKRQKSTGHVPSLGGMGKGLIMWFWSRTFYTVDEK